MALVTQTFTSSTTWTVPTGIYQINDIFVLGGGGGGGWNGGGGGGGGGITISSNLQVTPGTGITVTVGPGGAGATTYTTGASGTGSAFASVTAPGGAGGGSYNVTSYITGNDSRGGNSGTNTALGTAFNGGSGRYNGQQSPGDGIFRVTGGGGGGAAQNGLNSGDFPGNGGNGFVLTWNNTTYGGGGGGGVYRYFTIGNVGIGAASGGLGGGADGGSSASPTGQNASPNTGGGGGGGGNNGGTGNGGTGGSGIVIIRYWEPTYTLTVDPPGDREDRSITLRLRTTNVPNGSSVGYTISGAGVNSGDFVSASLSGSFTISSVDSGGNGTASDTITLSPDATTEGNETVTFSLLNGFASVTVVIGDFSTGALPSIETTKITATQYKNIRNKVVGVLGTGTGSSGYGQTVYSTAVEEGNTITVNEWDRLRYDIINAWTHIYGTVPAGLVTANNLVDTLIRGNNSSQPYSQYDAYANAIVAARFTQPSVANGQAFTLASPKVQYSVPWSNRLYSIVSVGFTSAAAARYFFNSGGEIRFVSSRSGGTGTTQDNSWTTLLTNAGTAVFGGALPVAGSGTDGKNFYRCTNSFQTMFLAQGSNAYASNTWKISVRTPGIANNSTGTASTVEFLIEWLDDHTGVAGGPDSITGVTDLTVSKLQATGNLSPAFLGAWAIEDPSISIGAILT